MVTTTIASPCVCSHDCAFVSNRREWNASQGWRSWYWMSRWLFVNKFHQPAYVIFTNNRLIRVGEELKLSVLFVIAARIFIVTVSRHSGACHSGPLPSGPLPSGPLPSGPGLKVKIKKSEKMMFRPTCKTFRPIKNIYVLSARIVY